jgi:hypothetical protein
MLVNRSSQFSNIYTFFPKRSPNYFKYYYLWNPSGSLDTNTHQRKSRGKKCRSETDRWWPSNTHIHQFSLEDEETGSANRNAVFIIERNVIIINKNQTIRVEFVAVQITNNDSAQNFDRLTYQRRQHCIEWPVKIRKKRSKWMRKKEKRMYFVNGIQKEVALLQNLYIL